VLRNPADAPTDGLPHRQSFGSIASETKTNMSLLGAGLVTSGDIWSTGAFSFESPLKDLLDSGDYTTADLLAQDELLQELRGLHPLLTKYFGSPEVVTELVHYIILGPNEAPPGAPMKDEESSEETKAEETAATATVPGDWLYRYLDNKSEKKTETDDPVLVHLRFPYMACEILCCELPGTIDELTDGYVAYPNQKEEADIVDSSETVEVVQPPRLRILDLLFSVLHKTSVGALDDYRAGYLDKILTVLFRRRPEAMSDYFDSGGHYEKKTAIQAMLQHLYSYSMMQVTQRLLLPPRPVAAKPDEAPPSPTADGLPEAGQDILGGEEDLDDGADPDMNGAGIKCDWYKSKEAMDWLMRLMQGHPVAIDKKTTKLSGEQRLALSLNASEVIITIIQNSMLSSETMLRLTSPMVWQKLVWAALPSDKKFSSSESLQTSAMNVIESLILQLGGYGAIGTMSVLPEDGGENGQEEDIDEHELIADLENLLGVLPELLEGFASLLTHPSAKEWKSCMQFSQHQPVHLLGMSRLRIVRVLESLVLLGDPEIDSRLVASGCLRICLDLFWQFQWCSMLHQSVANLLVHIFEGQNARYEIQEYFMVRCNLLGLLIDSFNNAEHVIEEAKAAAGIAPVPDATELTELADPLPVSEEDVEAAMEAEAAGVTASSTASTAESKEGEPVGVSQSFRYGYMGHVIIICQALVQACSNDWAGGSTDASEDGLGSRLPTGGGSSPGAESGDSTVKTGGSEMEPLMIAELVKNHELAEQWNDFVSTSLSAEIAVQSTPLGGLSGPSTDSFRPGADLPPGGRRPGPDDDDMDMGSSAAAPPPPPRGMLGGGELIDMDDNDLDVAVSMLSNFGLGRPNTTATADDDSDGSGDFSGSGDSAKSYNSGETNNEASGYLFDDPLGKSGGLGIELGKLTRLGPSERKKNGAAEEKEEEEEENSSSDEEPAREEKDDDEDDEGKDDNVPVMDLFAGNFNHGGQSSPGDDKPADSQEGFGFANFDSAFDSSAPLTEPLETANTEPSIDLFGKSTLSVNDGFGDFVSADTAAGDEAEKVEAKDPFVKDDSTDFLHRTPSQDDDLAAAGDAEEMSEEWKTSFPTAFEEMDATALKIAPSDELEADEAALGVSSPSSVSSPEARLEPTPEENTADEKEAPDEVVPVSS
jgi:hypothetical protein